MSKFLTALKKLETSVDFSENVFLNGCRFSSPSANFTFGAYHHLPFGYSLILWGEPKSR